MVDFEQTKDFALEDDSLETQIAKALQPVKQQLDAKTREADQLRAAAQQAANIARERDAAARKALNDKAAAIDYAARTEHAGVANMLSQVESEMEHLKRLSKAAIETADGQAGADITARMAEAAARKVTLEQGKIRLEEELEARARQAQHAQQVARQQAQQRPVQRPAPRQGGDPFENAIAPLPENQKAWLRANKEKGYFDPQTGLKPEVLAAYYDGKAKGIDETSPQFVQHLDRSLGERRQDASERFQPVQQPPQSRGRATPSAPPSRDGGAQQNYRLPAEARLTKEQAITAERLGMTHAQYYAGIQEGVRRGKLPQSALNLG